MAATALKAVSLSKQSHFKTRLLTLRLLLAANPECKLAINSVTIQKPQMIEPLARESFGRALM
jgi:hypothetical protein